LLTGALPHAWDIILGNSKDKEIVDFLRATFSDRDFLEEENFTHAHQIVLGLNGRKLAEALEEQPNLTDSPDSRGNTPLIWAATRGDTENLQELLNYGASTDFRNNNGWNALYAAVNHSRLDCTITLLSYAYTDYKDGYGMTALHRACQQTDATFVELLLDHDLNVDEQDVFQRCPLALAAWRNNALGVAYLLDRGASREIRDIFGATPLLRAIQYAAVDAARVLLESKCDVLAIDHDSQTLMHRAVLSRDVSVIELLAEKRHTLRAININAKDKSGKTAKQRLQTVEPSAGLLKAFTAMIAALESAQQTIEAEGALASQPENDQDVFKDASEFQLDGSPTSSCQTTDDEKMSARAPCKGRAMLTKPLHKVSRNWASKYRNPFRSFDRHLDSASTSTVTLVSSRPKG
jgi:ankyrin repeat protein